DHFERRDAMAVDELGLDPALGQVARHLFTAAVDHYYGVLGWILGGCGDFACEPQARVGGIQQRSAQLDQKFHRSPAVSGKPRARFIFCMACPAAPFPRLSITATTTA